VSHQNPWRCMAMGHGKNNGLIRRRGGRGHFASHAGVVSCRAQLGSLPVISCNQVWRAAAPALLGGLPVGVVGGERGGGPAERCSFLLGPLHLGLPARCCVQSRWRAAQIITQYYGQGAVRRNRRIAAGGDSTERGQDKTRSHSPVSRCTVCFRPPTPYLTTRRR
jgi:hypothetical protein